MKVNLDIKSIIIGAILMGICLLTLGAVASHPALRVGRFEMETENGYAYVVDSISGQVWEKQVGSGRSTDSDDFLGPKL